MSLKISVSKKSRNYIAVAKEINSLTDKFNEAGIIFLNNNIEQILISKLDSGELSNGISDAHPNFIPACLNNIATYIYENKTQFITEYEKHFSKNVLDTLHKIIPKCYVDFNRSHEREINRLPKHIMLRNLAKTTHVIQLLYVGTEGQSYFNQFLKHKVVTISLDKNVIDIKVDCNTNGLIDTISKIYKEVMEKQLELAHKNLMYILPNNELKLNDLMGNSALTYRNFGLTYPTLIKIKQNLSTKAKKFSDEDLSEKEMVINQERIIRLKELVTQLKNVYPDLYRRVQNIKFTEQGVLIKYSTGEAILNYKGLVNLKTKLYMEEVGDNSYKTFLETFCSKNIFNLTKLELQLIYRIMMVSYDRKRKLSLL